MIVELSPRPDLDRHGPTDWLLDHGRRVSGWLEARREDCDGWRGWVRYSTGLTQTRFGWSRAELSVGEPLTSTTSARTRSARRRVRCRVSHLNNLDSHGAHFLTAYVAGT